MQNKPVLMSLLNDAFFIKQFNQFCHQHHIVEYYLVNKSGDFIFLDEHAGIYDSMSSQGKFLLERELALSFKDYTESFIEDTG